MAVGDIIKQNQNLELKQQLIDELTNILPTKDILYRNEQLRPYECDGLSSYSQIPLVVASPNNTAEVQKILKLCNRLSVPIVPRGSGTGLSGGAIPHPNGLTLNFSKMNRILDIDINNRQATVQPGVKNISISQAVEANGLYFAPDPSSQIICSVGGNYAENSGGLHCLKYGLTVNNILGATLITANGNIVKLGGQQLQQNGLDILAMTIGSEGLLGVVTELIVKLLPKPSGEKVMAIGFSTIEDASNCVAAIIASGITPAALEMMDNGSIRAIESFIPCGYPLDAQALLLCEVDGIEEEVKEQLELLQNIIAQYNAISCKISQSKEQRNQLWLGRKSAFPATAIIAPDYYCLDGTIPRKNIAEVLQKINDLSQQYSLTVLNVFHAGDGNLHPLVLYDNNIAGELEKSELLGEQILQTCLDAGGSISGEHGIGLEKIGKMCSQFNTQELHQFHQLKSAFDPNGIMNPGKSIPTLSRCAEFGAKHTHHKKPDKHQNIPLF